MEHLLITVTLRCAQLKESKCSINIIRPRSFFHTLISTVFINYNTNRNNIDNNINTKF